MLSKPIDLKIITPSVPTSPEISFSKKKGGGYCVFRMTDFAQDLIDTCEDTYINESSTLNRGFACLIFHSQSSPIRMGHLYNTIPRLMVAYIISQSNAALY